MADKWRFQAGHPAGSLSLSSQSSQDCDVLTTEDCSGSDEEDSKVSQIDGMPPGFNTYWRAAVEKPSDYNAWTKCVAYAEKEKNLAACRKAYDAFLTCFPLAHIFWKKYADIELHLGSAEESEKIFTRAVKCNPLNVTLWTSYLLFLLRKSNRSRPASAEKLQSVFCDAVDACGMDFHSDGLWSLYIEYKIEHGKFKEAMTLYDRVLNIPTEEYDMHFERLKVLISAHSPVEFLPMEELTWIYAKIQSDNDNDQVAAEDLPADSIADLLTEIDLQKIRQHILDTRKQMYLLNEVQVGKRCVFEQEIKRVYFFATPVNVKQLQNWRRYLNFEMSEGQHERIVVLYERCLMPCALYEEFWLSYARYMEGHSVEVARSIFERACRIHLPLKFTLHLQWALFEEKYGQLDSARGILCNLESMLPGVVMVRLRHVNFERRVGNLPEAERLLREALEKSTCSEMAIFYASKLARLLLKLKKDPEEARDVLIEALKLEPNSPYLYQCLLETEICRNAADDVMHCVERALNSNIHDTIKGILSQRRLEFLEDCGNSIKSLLNAFDEHQTLLKREKLKRKANDEDKEDENYKEAKIELDKPCVKDISTPEVIPLVTTSVAPSLVSTQSVSATKSTVSSKQTTVNVPTSTKSVQAQPSPTAKAEVPVQRSPVRQYVPPPRAPRPSIMSHFSGHPTPSQRMPFSSFMSVHHMATPMPLHNMAPPMSPHHLGGPPGHIPPFNYQLWFQNVGGYNNPPPWNYNRFYPPY